jgi:hypothetical protein
MPLDTKPEDFPAAVCFSVTSKDGKCEVACALLDLPQSPPYRIERGTTRFESRDAFKARAIYSGLTPAVAEDQGRSFNATARQLRELGFLVTAADKEIEKKEEKAA